MSVNRNSPTQPKQVKANTERMMDAAKMRAAGATFREIGAALGIDHTWARELVIKALEAAPYEAADVMRTQEGERLDRLQRAYWVQALEGDARAAALVLRILDRRAKLFGLDAPVKVEAEVVTTDAIDATIQALAEQLAS